MGGTLDRNGRRRHACGSRHRGPGRRHRAIPSAMAQDLRRLCSGRGARAAVLSDGSVGAVFATFRTPGPDPSLAGRRLDAQRDTARQSAVLFLVADRDGPGLRLFHPGVHGVFELGRMDDSLARLAQARWVGLVPKGGGGAHGSLDIDPIAWPSLAVWRDIPALRGRHGPLSDHGPAAGVPAGVRLDYLSGCAPWARGLDRAAGDALYRRGALRPGALADPRAWHLVPFRRRPILERMRFRGFRPVVVRVAGAPSP